MMTTIDMYLLTPLKDVFHTVIGIVPIFLTVFVTLILGYLLAKLLRDVLHRVFKEVHVDKVTDKLGLSRLLTSGGVKHGIGYLFAAMIYLLVIFTFVMMALSTVGVESAAGLTGSLVAYVTPVLSAVFVMVVGLVLSKIIGGIIYLVTSTLELPDPKLHERITRWAIILYAVKLSLSELGLGFLFVGTVFYIWFAGLVLGLALAFGLGGRDAAAKYISGK